MTTYPRAALSAGLYAVVVFFLAAFPTRLDSQDPEPELQDRGRLTQDTFYDMESVSGPAISPQGNEIVFTRRWVDQMRDRSTSNLWIVDTEGKRPRELTSGSWQDSSPLWSPDGERIAFLSDRDGTSQVHVLFTDTREVAQLTRLDRSPQDLAWSPDGKRLAFTLFVPDSGSALEISLPKAPKGAEQAKPAVVIDRPSWARDGSGFQPQGYRHVFVVDAVLGGTPRQITTGDYHHDSPGWSADGRTIYFSAIRKPDAPYLRGDSEVYAVDLIAGGASDEVRTLTERKGPDRGPKVSPNGKYVAYSGYDDQRFTSHLSSLYVMDAAGENERLLAGDLASSPRGLVWSADSSGVYFTLGERGSYQIYFAPVSPGSNGKPRKITDGVHVLSGLSVAANGQIATVRSTFQQPGELVTFRPTGSAPTAGSEMKSLIDVNHDVLEGIRLGEAEELWFRSKDGLDVQGWLIKPPGLEPGRKVPMLLWIHGGPWSMYSVGFNWAWQNFAAKDYTVLYLNPRGSTGYGQDFVNGIQYAYPGRDYDDLMAGVDAAVAKGFIDEDNLFVCGGSGGGVLTAWIVGHTDRFRAAASMRPVINWHSFVGTTDGISWYDQFEKYPWEDPMEYFERSPLSYVDNVTTPTMVMTGEADLRTPMTQSEELYRALKVLKKDTLLVRVPEEYHGWRRPSNRLRQQLYLQAWFEKHATGDAWKKGFDEQPSP